jgi:oligopeptide transport system permease protein
MGRYILKRLMAAVFTLFVAATVTFFIMHFVPGGPFMSEKAPSPEVRQQMEPSTGWTSRFSSST